MRAINKEGASVRGFSIYLTLNGSGGVSPVVLPCAGEPFYTGEQALAVMQAFKKGLPRMILRAYTNSDKGDFPELLTLKHMDQLFGGDDPAV